MVKLAVHGILISDNSVFLLKRSKTGYYDEYYTTPGGHVEVGESLQVALLRELNEEIGITFHLKDVELITTTERIEKGNHRLDFFLK